MTTSLTDTQLVLLSRAAQREDGLIPPLDHLKGGAARQVATRLIAQGLAVEVIVPRDAPAWRRDEASGQAMGLRVTAAGLRAIGVEPHEQDPEASTSPHMDALPQAPVQEPPQARAGTKRALVLSLLGRPEGASLDELVAATGWLPHTTRAALTGLRQAGHHLARSKDANGRTVYRIGAALPESPAADTPVHAANQDGGEQ